MLAILKVVWYNGSIKENFTLNGTDEGDKMKTYAYIRVSTKKQSYERQMHNIERKYPNDVIIFYQEKESGKDNSRPVWNRLLHVLASGDRVIFDSVSRMSRDAEEGTKTYFELVDRGVELCFINEPYINSDVYVANCQDKIQLTGNDEDEIFKGINSYFRKLAARQIRIAFDQAEKEGRDISTRVTQGMAAKNAGEKISASRTGRTFETAKARQAKETIRELSRDFNGTLSDPDVMKYAKIARNSYYKYKKEMKEELAGA